MADIDTDELRRKLKTERFALSAAVQAAARNELIRELPPLLDHIDRLRAENQRLTNLNRRALAIIADAIMHGMPITEEVAAVRNGIVRGEESLRALTKEAGE